MHFAVIDIVWLVVLFGLLGLVLGSSVVLSAVAQTRPVQERGGTRMDIEDKEWLARMAKDGGSKG